jgi:Methionine biosynthesis protein MetW
VPVRIEDIIERLRRDIAADADAPAADASSPEADQLPAIASRAELEYLNRHWQLFDPLSEMRSHRRLLGPLVLRCKWLLRRLVLGVLDRYFEKERFFLLELVRFNNALAERSDRLLREVTERTKAVAERNDLFLGALDLRLEAIEAREQLRRSLAPSAAGADGQAEDAEEAVLAEMAVALGRGIAERVRPFVAELRGATDVLVLGCGDGEVFAALDGVAARGVEASSALVRACRGRGVSAELASVARYLESLPEGSLGGLVVTRVADRHPRSAWPRLVAAAWRSLRSGGAAVFEGVGAAAEAARLRWLAARQRFAIVGDVAVAPGDAGGADHVLVVRRREEA